MTEYNTIHATAITGDTITAGSITMERIEMGKYYSSVNEWQKALRYTERDLSVNLGLLPPAEYTVFAEDNVPVVSDMVVGENKYTILYKEEHKPYVVIELIEDLEYGIVDISERKTIKRVPLDVNDAIDTCKFWNEQIKHGNGGSHFHEFKTVSDELGMLHSTCWCGEDRPSPVTPAFTSNDDIVKWKDMDWFERALASTILFSTVGVVGLIIYLVILAIKIVVF